MFFWVINNDIVFLNTIFILIHFILIYASLKTYIMKQI